MLQHFFITAMRAPARHVSFRRLVGLHVLVLAALAWTAARAQTPTPLAIAGQLLLVLGIVEGAVLIGWRLTQIPRSQALEFLLVSPLHPRNVFVAEALVGIARFALISAAGVPVLIAMVLGDVVEFADLWALAVMPFVCGVFTGLALTTWAYESESVRRVGEYLGIIAVLVYLVVGILAGENLRAWLNLLPKDWAERGYRAAMIAYNGNPFGVMRNWFDPQRDPLLVWRRFVDLHFVVTALIGLCGLRAAFRLKAHFHDRHYRPQTTDRATQIHRIGDRPLAWWAVRRVMEYSGRVNVWLAGGFSLLYAAYLVAGPQWPAWMGRLVFQIFEMWGGAAVVATGLCVMATVPAAFQYGLWDATPTDRCRRLELLLLTQLNDLDYWHASLAAAWKRGRGYLVIAGVLWIALAVSGRNHWTEVLAAATGAVVLWTFAFAVGFRAFCTGRQASGIASLVTIGLPLLLFLLLRTGLTELAGLVPTAMCYLPLRDGLSWNWAAGLILCVVATCQLTQTGLARCESELRMWYNANQGRKAES